MGIFSDDIVRDILERVVRAAQSQGGFDESLAEQIERQVRQDWGTQRPYIQVAKDDRLFERNEKICELFESRLYDIPSLAVRFGLSTKQVKRIVGR